MNHHRVDEGKSIEKELLLRIKNINAQEEEILKLEPVRKEKMKEELVRLLEDNVGKENYDANRLE
ncbi:MAG: YicC/YloC family endoribonuclease, partial [Chitinophagaceae bacterium]